MDLIFYTYCFLSIISILFMNVHSERSDECIDFTIIITSQNNAPISNLGGGFRCQSEYPWCIIEVKSKHLLTSFQNNREKRKKNDGKTGIFTQNQFSTKSIFLYGYDSKTNHCKYLKFSPNFYVLYEFSDFYDICRKRKKSQIILKLKNHKINDNDLSSNDFKYLFISRRYLKILPLFIDHRIQILTKIRQNHEYLQIIFYKITEILVLYLFIIIKLTRKTKQLTIKFPIFNNIY
ncbi:Uncharacterized protein FWK35_00000053 [Aphis craccivora]|uniref:Uncharacterized protein n=1 Tax=Aphis craccivora TaxID=307492 RepID=A0A6G0ZQY7_APHCR|nr:Uncharacterized protein FWK35_00000053 [Aphis craccivora]